MSSGYKIIWSENALEGLRSAIEYLETHWTEKQLRNFSRQLESKLILISNNPKLYQVSTFQKDIRRAVFLKYYKLYYKINRDSVILLSLFHSSQNPKNFKIEEL